MLRSERIFLFLLFLLASGAGQSLFTVASTTSAAYNQPFTQVLFALVYLGILLYLVRNYRRKALSLVKREKWTAILCIWVLASTLWSVDPEQTFRRALALLGTSMVGLYIGMKFEPKDQLKIIGLVVALGAVGSLIVGLFLPGKGVDVDGAWQGVYFPKNALGRMMAFGAIGFVMLTMSERRHRIFRGSMFLLCCLLLALSRSATALVVTALIFAFLPFRKFLFLKMRSLILFGGVAGVVVGAVVIWVVNNSEKLLGGFGRNATLTGRIPLWQYVVKEIATKPIKGWGFACFWDSWEGSRVSDAVAWETAVPHAHNGFLETWLGLGIIGLVLVLIGLGRNFFLGVQVAKSDRKIENMWPVLLVMFTVLYNFTETSLLAVNSILWMAYVANAYWLVRVAGEEKRIVELGEVRQPVYSV